MNPWIRSGEAPGYTVVTLTTVFDSFGYCRIGRLVAALKPISRIKRLTTTLSTGRLMKMSVQAMTRGSSVTRRLRWNRRRPVGRDGYRGTRLQFQLADRDPPVAVLHAGDDFGAAVDPVAGAHKGSHRRQTGLAVILLLLGDN